MSDAPPRLPPDGAHASDPPAADSRALDRRRLSLSPEAMRRLGYRAVDHLVARWAGLADAPIPAAPDRAALRRALDRPPSRAGREPGELLDDVVQRVLAQAAPTGHPRFFGFIPAPSSFLGVLADALVAGFNPFLGNWMEAPGPHELERATVGWVRDACGLPPSAAGLFVTGGSMANLTALVAARERRLGHDVAGARVYVSDQTHRSVTKALKILGFSPDAAAVVPSDAAFRMDVDALARAVARDRADGRRPFCVVATSGTTSTGAVDPLVRVADLADREGLWMHVDGAYGAAAVFAPTLRPALAGLERADSLSLDPHKWLFTPYECACVLVRDGAALTDAFAAPADYLADTVTDEPDFQDQGVQLTRAFRALKLWMTLEGFGLDAVAGAIEAGVARAERVERAVRALDGWEVAAPASLGICAFRSLRGEDPDALNFALVPALLETGEAMVTSTVLRNRRWLRMCTINPRSTDADIERTMQRLDALSRALEGASLR